MRLMQLCRIAMKIVEKESLQQFILDLLLFMWLQQELHDNYYFTVKSNRQAYPFDKQTSTSQSKLTYKEILERARDVEYFHC